MKPRSLILTAAFLMLSAVNALAAERFVYESKKLQDVLAAGKPILVHVTAPWCGECKQQKPIVAALAAGLEQHECCEPAPILLCMGLFSRFCVHAIDSAGFD